jgi:hypothetical protein
MVKLDTIMCDRLMMHNCLAPLGEGLKPGVQIRQSRDCRSNIRLAEPICLERRQRGRRRGIS